MENVDTTAINDIRIEDGVTTNKKLLLASANIFRLDTDEDDQSELLTKYGY